MPRTVVPRFSLLRKLIRNSWNKQNLYNLATKRVQTNPRATMFQQKWQGKKESRAFHGEHMRERQLLNQLHLSMKPSFTGTATSFKNSPIYSNSFASLERRLDVAVFRAMFASSIFQARQMCIHGKVSVNGERVNKPYRELQPGDVFSVDPATVMRAVMKPLDKKPEDVRKHDVLVLGRDNFTPKDYMAPWAFVPEYLEVSHRSCSAVYVRDPIVRPTRTEVPSPVSPDLQAKAFLYYITRRSTRHGFLRRRARRLPVNWGSQNEHWPAAQVELFD